MKTLNQQSFESLKSTLKALPRNRKTLTDYCRQHGFNSSDAVFDIYSSIHRQGKQAV